MLSSPNSRQPVLGLLLNGREFMLIKVQQETLQYIRSYALSLEREEEIDQVLSVLKRLALVIALD